MKYIAILFLQLYVVCLPAQDQISGKVVSEKGAPLAGASIYITNTGIGTATNNNGEFVLEKIPGNSFKVTVSFMGYETVTKNIERGGARKSRYIIRLKSKTEELDEVVIRQYDKDGWNKWGTLFIRAFIGESSYAENCVITNKDIIHFIQVSNTNNLRAYAAEPIIIENKSLGYRIKVDLAEFNYDLKSNEIDYQVYSFFTQMEGTKSELEQWKKNRAEAYAFSLMRFTRCLYNNTCSEEGFEMRTIENIPNIEKRRVQDLYKKEFARVRELQSGGAVKEKNVMRLVEKSFPKDSLKYYNSILKQEDKMKKYHTELVTGEQLISKTDTGTVIFNFEQTLQVLNKKQKEPAEFYRYKNKLDDATNQSLEGAAKQQALRLSPVSELILTQNIPVEINESGYFNNIDLFFNGFWGWWEKLAVKLPYDYQPE